MGPRGWHAARFAALAALAAALGGCGGGGESPAPATIPQVFDRWHFELTTTGADPYANELNVLPEHTLQGQALLNLYPDDLNAYNGSGSYLGKPQDTLAIHPKDRLPFFFGQVTANDTGQTFWAVAVAPPGDVYTPHSRIGLRSDLEVTRVLKKTAAGASIRQVFNRAILEAIDGNPRSPRGNECPWVDANPNDDCAESMSASIEATVEAYALLPNGGQVHLRTAGFTARLNGWRGHWHFIAAPTASSELWTTDDDAFRLENDPADTDGQFIRYGLSRAVVIDVPTDVVALDQQVVVATRIKTTGFNRRQLESYAAAYLRDPASGQGITFEEQGVEVVRVEVPQPPPAPLPAPPRAPAPDCAAAPAGSIDLAATQLDAHEQFGARAWVPVRRSGGAQGAASVRMATRDDTAHAGVDYAAQDLVVRFEDGEQGERLVEVPIIDNAAADGDRRFTLALSDARGCATMGPNASATVTIRDDDTRVTASTPLHVGGSVTGLLGSGLVIEEVFSGTTVAPSADGVFTMPATWLTNTLYDVRVRTQPTGPAQSCTVSRGSGTIGSNDVTDIAVTCTVVAASGSLDTGFGNAGRIDHALPAAKALALQFDGRLVTAGGMTVARFLADGTPDPSFGSAGSVVLVANGGPLDALNAVALQADGRIVVAGQTAIGLAADDIVLMRLNPDGSLDAGFGSGGKVVIDVAGSTDRALALAVQADGRIVAAGLATLGSGASVDQDVALVRVNADGSLDTSFGNGGKVTTNVAGIADEAHAIAIQADGKLLVAGRVAPSGGADPDMAVLRYLSDGRLDSGFAGTGIVRIDLGGTGAWDEAAALRVQADGKVIAAGQAVVGGSTRYALLRLNADGSRDTTFGSNGVVSTAFTAGSDIGRGLALQGDGRIVVAGQVATLSGGDMGIARYLADGSLDAAFGSAGLVRVDFYGGIDNAYALALQADGRIVAAGAARNGSSTQLGLVRVMP